MTTFIALLRGINVGGHRVKMEQLRSLFGELGLTNVRSFIQSGNIFFDTSEENPVALASRIEAHLEAKLGYTVPVFLRTPDQLNQILFPNPFEDVEVTPGTRLLVVFSAQPLSCEQPLPIRLPDGSVEILQTTPGETFVVYRLTNGKPPDVGAFLKRVFGKKASATTTRFYDTTLKMLREVQTVSLSDPPENS